MLKSRLNWVSVILAQKNGADLKTEGGTGERRPDE